MNEKSPTLKRDWASFDVVVWLPIPLRPQMIEVEYSIFRGSSRNAPNQRGSGWGFILLDTSLCSHRSGAHLILF
jgi:hypothetical protein